MNHSIYHAPGTPVSLFAPFFQRHPRLFAYAEDDIKPEHVFEGLIVGYEPSDSEEKYLIVINAQRYGRYLAKLQRGDDDAREFSHIYLIPGSQNYDENVQLIGLRCYARSEIPDETFNRIVILREKREQEPTFHHREF